MEGKNTMTYVYTLPGEVPSKKNGRVVDRRSGKNFPSKQYQRWHDDAVLSLMTQERPSEPIEKCTSVCMVFYHADKIRRDTNNQMASVFDLLVDCGVLTDDNWRVTGVESGKGVLCTDGEGARCEVQIETEVENDQA